MGYRFPKISLLRVLGPPPPINPHKTVCVLVRIGPDFYRLIGTDFYRLVGTDLYGFLPLDIFYGLVRYKEILFYKKWKPFFISFFVCVYVESS